MSAVRRHIDDIALPNRDRSLRPASNDVPAAELRTLKRLDVARFVSEVPEPPPWVIEGLAVRGCLTVLHGPPGVGKSLLAGSLAAGVALGTSEAGMACEQGGVLLIDAENGRFEQHRRVHSLGLPAAGVSMYETEGFDLRYHLGELESLLELHRPTLLILDSFRSLWRGEENDSEAVSGVLDALRNMVRKFDVATILLHHSGKGQTSSFRGSSAIDASCELRFGLRRWPDDGRLDRRVLECWKCRCAPEPARRWIALRAEDGNVYIDQVDAPVDDAEVRKVPAPVKEDLRPRVKSTLSEVSRTTADIARAVGRDPKDRSVRRVLNDLAGEGEAEKDAEGWWRVAGGSSPGGFATPATLPPSGENPCRQAENHGGEQVATVESVATLTEAAALDRNAQASQDGTLVAATLRRYGGGA